MLLRPRRSLRAWSPTTRTRHRAPAATTRRTAADTPSLPPSQPCRICRRGRRLTQPAVQRRAWAQTITTGRLQPAPIPALPYHHTHERLARLQQLAMQELRCTRLGRRRAHLAIGAAEHEGQCTARTGAVHGPRRHEFLEVHGALPEHTAPLRVSSFRKLAHLLEQLDARCLIQTAPQHGMLLGLHGHSPAARHCLHMRQSQPFSTPVTYPLHARHRSWPGTTGRPATGPLPPRRANRQVVRSTAQSRHIHDSSA